MRLHGLNLQDLECLLEAEEYYLDRIEDTFDYETQQDKESDLKKHRLSYAKIKDEIIQRRQEA